VERAVAEIGAAGVDSSTNVAKVSIIGLGMRTHTGVADRMFHALAREGINILMITTSEIKISVLVDRDRALDALRAVHREFELHEPLPELREDIRYRAEDELLKAPNGFDERLQAIVRRLPAMEDILVTDVEQDDRQARLSLFGVPDRPGIAYHIFSTIAKANIPVDMIVQNVGTDGTAHLSFTIRRSDLPLALERSRGIMHELGGGQVIADDGMSKISVRGVGMRSHSGVAVRMFDVLAARGINIQLINTSELHITVVVDRVNGTTAAAALREAFGVDAW
jgi:aspartate kinase